MRPTIRHHTFDTRDALDDALYALIEKELSLHLARPHAVMLSGGSTPVPVYERIAQQPFSIAPTACVTYSDDRHVPPDSPDSNYGVTQPMLKALGLPDERVLRVETEHPLDEAAEAFHNRLADFMLAGGRITLALLGLGSDGHTCSLFTTEDLDRGAGRYAVAVPRPQPPNRVSVTPNTLVHCERVVFVVSGEDKAAVARQFLETPERLVAGQAVAGREEVELWQV